MAEIQTRKKAVCSKCEKQFRYGDDAVFFMRTPNLGLLNSMAKDRKGEPLPEWGITPKTTRHSEKGFICLVCWQKMQAE